MALTDLDGDGDLDLFVGGRARPGRFPESLPSRLFRETGEAWVADAEDLFAGAGLVNAAVFTDLDADGFPELVLACEWGPVRIFRNTRGQLTAWNAPVTFLPSPLAPSSTLDALTGWWTGVAAGDFDGDGRMDLVVGNLGRNTPRQPTLSQPWHLFFGDFNGDGSVALVEACFDEALGKVVPWRHGQLLGAALPFLRERYPTATAFSTASAQEVLGEGANRARELRVTTCESMLFLNRGESFEARPLPVDAQFAPVFAVNVADFDGDGNDDVFLGQNLFAVDAETPRLDGGRGLLLAGDGRGALAAMSAARSGLFVYGEQRGAAAGDFDGDGRVDLVVTQRGSETKLFHNETARPGVRVRLAGPPGNRAGFGASLRVNAGPRREVRAGSGFWSQDSPVQVVAALAPATLSLRWPGGKVTTVDLPAGAREVEVALDGSVRRIR
jgi:hypothetical protein